MSEDEPPSSVVILRGSNGSQRNPLSISLKDYLKVAFSKTEQRVVNSGHRFGGSGSLYTVIHR